MTRCECCDLPVESCGKALETRQRAEAKARRQRALASDPRAFPASYDGTCACGDRFKAGTPIVHTFDGWVDLVAHPEGLHA